MDCIEFVIRKEKSDLLSSLKALDEVSLRTVLDKNNLNTVDDLYNKILDNFRNDLSSGKVNKEHMLELLDSENTHLLLATPRDIESFYVFVYDNNEYLSYFVPDEIKKLINE